MKPVSIAFVCMLLMLHTIAQPIPDKIYANNIKTVKLFKVNNQESLPILSLNSNDQLELHFDDLDGTVKDYYYTYQLCNADWQPADLSPFDYIKGFTQGYLTQYRMSALAGTKYVHYQTLLPEQNMAPSKSGNYILKVYLSGDESNPVFTKRMYVVDRQVSAGVQLLQPFDNNLYTTYQKLQLNINLLQLDAPYPQQQIKVTVLQNFRWDNAITNLQPTFVNGSILEYNGEDCLFPGGKEYRWADVRSFRYESDRIDHTDRKASPYIIYLKPDGSRASQPYVTYKDLNGWYNVSTTEFLNPWWETDYAKVRFTFVPPNHKPFDGKNVYLLGEITGNDINDDGLMEFNSITGTYQKTLLLKQGFYAYTYVTKDNSSTSGDVSLTDGNYWETENDYTILVYYRSFSDRYDELVCIKNINTRAVKSR